tara:strand:+ start:434 stop:649 length:216 start_codon:yes stop_codon:yes gene_type:complete
MKDLVGSVVIIDDYVCWPLIGVIIRAKWSSIIDDHVLTIKWTDLEEDVYSYSYLRKYIHLQRSRTDAINNP